MNPTQESRHERRSLPRRIFQAVDFRLLVAFLCLSLLIWSFLQLAEWIQAGSTDRLDSLLLRSFRDDTPDLKPRGPAWLVGAVRDFTALGSAAVLSLLTIAVSLYYFLQRRWRTGLFILVTTTLGWGLMEWIKVTYARPRPAIVPHLVTELSYSFPSGHAKMSAVVYLTLGALLAQRSRRKRVKVFWIGLTALLTLLIGCTRVYLGVHHPSDVVAGWAAGTAWAILAFLLARLWRHGLAHRRRREERAISQPPR
jgi:undecaprenyl-diphosphatase